MARTRRQAQVRRRRKAYRPEALAVGASAVKPKGAFRLFASYRLFAIIGAVGIAAGLFFSAYAGVHGGVSSHGQRVRGHGVVRSTPEERPTRPAARPVRQYPAPPPLSIDTAKTYIATLKTERGEVRIELLARDAPATVNNFVFLSREGFYNGVTFFRAIADRQGLLHFVQAGDPTETGLGGPGYDLPAERTGGAVVAGTLAMAKPNEAGAPNNGSQFFITVRDEPTFDGKYTVFGRVIEGLDVLQGLPARDPQSEKDPPPGVQINSIEITES
jgi:cyclophilin family peptidyl-prolyl cis-trans isomerase